VAASGVMIEKHVVPIGAQARLGPQELPHFIERRLPRSSDAADCDMTPDGGKLHGSHCANGNVNTHFSFVAQSQRDTPRPPSHTGFAAAACRGQKVATATMTSTGRPSVSLRCTRIACRGLTVGAVLLRESRWGKGIGPAGDGFAVKLRARWSTRGVDRWVRLRSALSVRALRAHLCEITPDAEAGGEPHRPRGGPNARWVTREPPLFATLQLLELHEESRSLSPGWGEGSSRY